MSQRFQDKIAVITGGNSGIGLTTAHRLVAQGARVVLFGRDQASLDRAVTSLEGRALGVRGDVTSLDDLERLFTTTREHFGRIDILVVNAGVALFTPTPEVTPEFFAHLFDVNVKGAYFTVQKALGLLPRGASVVLIGSVIDRKGMPGGSVYAATKAALRSLARSLSAELLPQGVRVNVVSPGPIETPIFGRMGLPPEVAAQMGQSIVSQVPVGRMGTPDEVAHAIAFLASDESTFIVGADLAVDGGMTQL